MTVPTGTVHVIERWHAACNAHDVDAVLPLVHPEVEIHPDPGPIVLPRGTRYYGHDGVRSLMAHVAEMFPGVRTEIRRLSAMGEWTAAHVTMRPDPAAPLGVVDRVILYALEGGRLIRMRSFASEAEALAAAMRRVRPARELFDRATRPALLIDDAARVTCASPAAVELLADNGPLVGRGMADVLPGLGWAQAWHALRVHGHTDGQVVLPGGATLRLWCSARFASGLHLVLLHPVDGAPATPRRGEDVLTGREREVLALLASGLTAPEIAERLVLSPATVRTHVQNAIGRLGARTRVHAIATALVLGEIDPP